MSRLKLLPGTPDDLNRDYLPESIKGSDIVVNENGNNSRPYPERLIECTGVLADGLNDRWYVYVPEKYDGSSAVPLVVGLHGGLMTGWGHSIYTSWCYVADREGLICVFPDAHTERMWTVEGVFDGLSEEDLDGLPIALAPKDYRENHDLNMVRALIEKMQQDYRIDPGRIFMQGMSMGNVMTQQFCKYYGDMLAGAAGSGGPTQPDMMFTEEGGILNYGGPMAIWQSRPEVNGLPPAKIYDEFTVNKMSRTYWMRVNECGEIPEISIVGEDNFAFFRGRKADLVYLDIKNRDHGQTLDEAFLYWDYLFSGVRKTPEGRVISGEGRIPRKGDAFAAAFTEGNGKAWFHNRVTGLSQPPVLWQKCKYHGLNGGTIVRGEYLMVPLQFLAEMFGAEYRPSADTLTAEVILRDGRELQFARGSIVCAVDDTMRQMYCEALHRNGELLVSAEWFCRYFFNLHVSRCNGVTYVTDHFAELSCFMADLIKDILNGSVLPDDYSFIGSCVKRGKE
ncbi:MAG: hypothetical protein IJL78_07805 [Lachnospiraceae bacterium]|nr:hypothetical protein [Lachnospiraceae bacterium]